MYRYARIGLSLVHGKREVPVPWLLTHQSGVLGLDCFTGGGDLSSQPHGVVRTGPRRQGSVMPLLGAICHVGITVSDLDNAMGFFKPFLEFLGYEIWDEIRNPNGQRDRVAVNHGNGAVLNLWEAKPEFAKHPFEVYEVGLHHIAFYTDA